MNGGAGVRQLDGFVRLVDILAQPPQEGYTRNISKTETQQAGRHTMNANQTATLHFKAANAIITARNTNRNNAEAAVRKIAGANHQEWRTFNLVPFITNNPEDAAAMVNDHREALEEAHEEIRVQRARNEALLAEIAALRNA